MKHKEEVIRNNMWNSAIIICLIDFEDHISYLRAIVG